MNGRDELRELWSSQPPCEKKGEDIVVIVQKKIRHFDGAIAVRNLVECIAAGIVVLCFGWLGVRTHDALMRAGFLVIAAGGAWIIYYLIRYGNTSVSVDPSQTLVDYTRALVERYDHQIRLLKSVKYWYLLPPYVGLLITSAALFLERRKTASLSWHDLAFPTFYTAVYAAVWWLNEVYSVGRLRKQRARLLSMTEGSRADL